MNTALALSPPNVSSHPTHSRPRPAPLRSPARDTPYLALVDRLSRASVKKHFDAYEDVAWEDPEYAILPHDPRWIKDGTDPIGATDYYRALPFWEQARIGLAITAFQMKTGIAFESILQRGLLELASTLPNGSPEFRYAYHEIIEEGQHSLMFQELVNRSGFDPPAMSGLVAWQARKVPALGRTFPELFFLHVLAGEAPIDHVQRHELSRGDAVHPLQRRIMQIHVTEEARHVCFAERTLEERVPRLGAARLLKLRMMTPFVLRETTAQILKPPAEFFDAVGVPRAVVREAYSSEVYWTQMREGLRPVRDLCARLGIVTPAWARLWSALGIWARQGDEKALLSEGGTSCPAR